MKRFRELTYYEILEITPRSSRREVETAYQKIKEIYRADALPLYSFLEGEDLQEVQCIIDAAYRALASEKSRSEYDQHLISSGRLKPEEIPNRSTELRVRPVEDEESAREESLPAPQAPPAEKIVSIDVGRSTIAEESSEIKKAPDAQTEEKKEKETAEEKTTMEEKIPAEEKTKTEEKEPEPPPAPMRFDGTGLKAIRENLGIELATISRITKISVSKLADIEENRYSRLPARIYLKGFVKEYARCLGLDPEKVSEEYLRRSGK